MDKATVNQLVYDLEVAERNQAFYERESRETAKAAASAAEALSDAYNRVSDLRRQIAIEIGLKW